MAKISFSRFLLSPRGRISRRAYALFMLPLTLSLMALRMGFGASASHLPPQTLITVNLVLSLVEVVFLWPKFAAGSKRLHDFGWSGGLAVMHFLPFLAGMMYGITLVLVRTKHPILDMAPLRMAISIVVWSVWASVLVLCLVPGAKGMNRYGPPPRDGQTGVADVF